MPLRMIPFELAQPSRWLMGSMVPRILVFVLLKLADFIRDSK